MNQQWSKLVLLVLALVTLLLPGVRRFIFFRLIKNRFVRNMGLKMVFTSPYLRSKLVKNFIPTRRSKAQFSYSDGSDQNIL